MLHGIFCHTYGSSIKRIIYRVLFSHTGPVDAFKLSTERSLDAFKLSTERSLDAGDIDLWISRLSKYSIKEFILKIWDRSSTYNVFSRLFSFHSLTHLELCNCLLKPPSTFKGFRVLKGLHIQRVTVAQDALEKLIVSGPLLERMTLCDIKGLTQLNINARNRFVRIIKSLIGDGCHPGNVTISVTNEGAGSSSVESVAVLNAGKRIEAGVILVWMIEKAEEGEEASNSYRNDHERAEVSPVSDMVKINLCAEFPVMVEYKIAKRSWFRFYLAPIPKDEDGPTEPRRASPAR
ncbi:hypothetical protein ACLB2K_074602 [Fragaria x ananassa]